MEVNFIKPSDKPEYPTHAVHACFEHYEEQYVFAFVVDGVYYKHDDGEPVLLYDGDAIMQVWCLTRD